MGEGVKWSGNFTRTNPEGTLAKKIFCPQRESIPLPQIEPQKYPSSKDAANKSDKYSQDVTQDVRKSFTWRSSPAKDKKR
jgi:hypothetical protein